MTPIQIITVQYDKSNLYSTKRIMVEKLGENVFRAYVSIKEEGKVFSPFELNSEIYDSATSALFSNANVMLNKPTSADNQLSDLLTSNEVKTTLDIKELTES